MRNCYKKLSDIFTASSAGPKTADITPAEYCALATVTPLAAAGAHAMLNSNVDIPFLIGSSYALALMPFIAGVFGQYKANDDFDEEAHAFR